MAYPSDIAAVLDPSERQIYDALTLKGITRLKEREREQADRSRAFRAQINATETRHPKHGRGWL